MPKVGNSQDNYKQPTNELVRCPHCSKILNQHLVGIPVDSISDNSNGAVAVPPLIDLFRARQLPATGAAEPEPPEQPPVIITEPGDLYVPEEPRVVRDSEQVATNQANTKGRLHTIPGMQPKQPSVPDPPQVHPNSGDLAIMDNPVIGGKMTICVLLYGTEHHALHRRCLNSIVKSTPPSRMDLRVACNQVGEETMTYLNTLPITKIYPDSKQRRKYPAMRQMFRDPERPITTKYIVWFDDDSYARQQTWLATLSQVVVNQRPGDRVGMFGHLMRNRMPTKRKKDPRQWFRDASWFRGKQFRSARGNGTPNGDNLHFCVGGFWCLSTEAMLACDIPDVRLNHNGGDPCVGEQIWQNDFKLKQFNEEKQYVHTSAAPRRGFREDFPWLV